jgi:hypothetical protein
MQLSSPNLNQSVQNLKMSYIPDIALVVQSECLRDAMLTLHPPQSPLPQS